MTEIVISGLALADEPTRCRSEVLHTMGIFLLIVATEILWLQVQEDPHSLKLSDSFSIT